MSDPWRGVHVELDQWSAAGRWAHLWLRDDDATAPGAALDRLLGLCGGHGAPLLLGVIPMRAEEALARRLDGESGVAVAAHGAWHRNHAPPPRKSEETPAERGDEILATELAAARLRLTEMFGAEAGTWYIPPWNRISDEVAALLPRAGYRVLSTFADAAHGCSELIERNTHVDLIDWRGGRVGRSEAWIADRLAEELAKARGDGWRPVGILTHHLDHDAVAWSSLERLLAETTRHEAARWIAAAALLDP